MGKRIGYGALLLGILAWMLWKDFQEVAIAIGIFALICGIGIVAELMGFDSRVHGILAEERRAREKKRLAETRDSSKR